jgi:hypothetical protein
MLELLAPWVVVGIVCVMAYNCFIRVRNIVKSNVSQKPDSKRNP